MSKYILNLPLIWAIMSPLCAYAGGPKHNQPADDSKTEMQKQEMYQHDMSTVTPYAPPKIMRGADPFVTADFIWWRAQEGGLAYAFNGLSEPASTAISPTLNASKGTLKQPDFDFAPGFKVGMGLKFRHDAWDLYARYTWWQNRKGDSRSHIAAHGDTSILLPAISCPPQALAAGITTPALLSSRANWSIKLNAVDLELGRDMWLSKRLTLRPCVGLKFTWLEQKLDIRFRGISLAPTNVVDTKWNIDEWAMGLRFGADTSWFMAKNWTIFGELNANFMWNLFKTSRKEHFNSAFITNQVITNTRTSYHAVTATVEGAIGLRYETFFHNEDYMFMLQAGWEMQLWFDQNQFLLLPSSGLTTQGLTVKAGFYF